MCKRGSSKQIELALGLVAVFSKFQRVGSSLEFSMFYFLQYNELVAFVGAKLCMLCSLTQSRYIAY